jgi:excinuclease ABC subunit B
MYADNMTESMRKAITETNRRRNIQEEYNIANNITPVSIVKKVRDIISLSEQPEEKTKPGALAKDPESMSRDEIINMIKKMEKEMKLAAAELEFERAASIRDGILEMKKHL